MRALVILNGAIKRSALLNRLLFSESAARATQTADFVCAVDGGARHALDWGLSIDLLLGDFDSIEEGLLDAMRLKGVEVLRYPTRKNATDGELAVDEILALDCDSVLLLAGLGPERPDHVLANLALLARLRRLGLRAELSDGASLICALNGPERRRFSFSDEFGYCPYVSVLAQSEFLRELRYEGLAYPLTKELRKDSSLGVSNYPSFFDHCGRESFALNPTPQWSFSVALEAGEALLCLTPAD